MRSVPLLALALLVACGPGADPPDVIGTAQSNINGGHFRITEADTYGYTLGGSIAPCSYFRLVNGRHVILLTSRGGLVAPQGRSADGKVYLAAGRWAGQTAYEIAGVPPRFGSNPACGWTLTLVK
jgi:hypothetical protein